MSGKAVHVVDPLGLLSSCGSAAYALLVRYPLASGLSLERAEDEKPSLSRCSGEVESNPVCHGGCKGGVDCGGDVSGIRNRVKLGLYEGMASGVQGGVVSERIGGVLLLVW